MKRLEIHQDRRVRIARLIGTCVWMAAALFLLWGVHAEPLSADSSDRLWRLVSWPVAALTIGLVAHAVFRLFKPKPRLTLTEEGMAVAFFGLGRIPWKEIRDVHGISPDTGIAMRLAVAPFIRVQVAVELNDPDGFLERLSASKLQRSLWEGVLTAAKIRKLPGNLVPVMTKTFLTRRAARRFIEETVARINAFRAELGQ